MAWRELAVDIRPLRRHHELRLLLAGRGISFLGSMVTYVAVPFQVYDLTGSSLAVGLVGVAELAVLLPVAFLGGALADAHDRRAIVQRTEGALLGCAALLAVNAALPHPRLGLVFVLAAVMAGLDAIQRPSLDALIPRLVDPDELTAAAALRSVESTAAMILGPAVAGLLIAGPGLVTAFVVDGATFAASLVFLTAMRPVPAPEGAARPSLRRVAEGLRYARSRQELMGTYVVDMVAMFFGMPLALFPAMAERWGGAEVLGLLYSAPAAGAFLATVASGWTGRVHRHGRAVALAASVWGLGIVVFGLSPSLPLAVTGLVVAGGADMVSGIFRSAIWNRTPDPLRGRLASIEMVSYASGPALGNAEAGLAAALIGVRGSVVTGGALCIVGVIVAAAALPRFLAYDARAGLPAVRRSP